MFQTLALKVSEHNHAVVGAILGARFMNIPYDDAIDEHYLVLNEIQELDGVMRLTQVTLTNQLYKAVDFFDKYTMVHPAVDEWTQTWFFEVRIAGTQSREMVSPAETFFCSPCGGTRDIEGTDKVAGVNLYSLSCGHTVKL